MELVLTDTAQLTVSPVAIRTLLTDLARTAAASNVVADLGNCSSSAGAKQLYAMMDRVRKARHGTTEQPPEIDVRKLMPA